MISKLYIITDLDMGGAEQALLRLIQNSPNTKEVTVVSLVQGGVLRDKFESLGVNVIDLGLQYGQINLSALWKLIQIIRSTRPQIIHSWMYHANVLALVALKLSFFKSKLIWAIRQCIYEDQQEKRITRLVLKFSAMTSKWVNSIVYNSELSMHQHKALGVKGQENLCIPNGFEVAAVDKSTKIRSEIKIPNELPLIGLVGRYHPMKDYPTAIKSMVLLKKKQDFHAIFIGKNLDTKNNELMGLIKRNDLEQNVTLLGQRFDLNEIYASLDYFLLPSSSEAFPNVLAEAMSHGCICISTNVGECSKVLNDCGFLAKTGNSVDIAKQMDAAFNMTQTDRESMSKSARSRVQSEYGIDKITKLYHQLYERLLCAE